MSCPTCGHTMQNVANFGSLSIYHCPRCGTVKSEENYVTYVPEIVQRCREFAEHDDGLQVQQRPLWNRLGIEESIHLPNERK